NPTRGEIRSDLPMFAACPQSTPLVAPLACMSSLARPTPMIDPMRVCELEDGSPKYQVPTFQIIAATSRANTIANPAALPTWRINSTGSNETIVNATAPLEDSTPTKLHSPDHATAACGSSECV